MKIKNLFCELLALTFLGTAASCKPEDENGENGFTNIVLANEKTTDYTILVPQNPTPAISFAAEELQTFFFDATGATLPVKEETDESFDKNAKVISLGKTNVFEGSGMEISAGELTNDGYKIERKGNTVLICGGDDSGTSYGVYEFLSRQFNYECYAPDEIFIDETEKSYLYDFDLKGIPDFEGRSLDGVNYWDPVFTHRMRLRCTDISNPKFDYMASNDYVGGHCHTFWNLLPPTIYRAEHPEWYANTSNQLCMTNEELKAEMVKVIIQQLQDKPNAVYVNISENDMAGFCTCTNCKQEQNRYMVSGYLIRSINSIINEVEEWVSVNQSGRELKYMTFAYSTSIHAPVTQDSNGNTIPIDPSVVPHKKLYMRFAPLSYCYSHSFSDESCNVNASLAKAIEGWRTITDRFTVWDYDVNYNNYFMFIPVYDNLQKNMQMYKDMGVVNIFRQTNTHTRLSSMDYLKIYLTSKLMWDVDQNVEELINNFMEHYYKEGAPYMKQYFNMTRAYLSSIDSTKKGGLHFQLYNSYQPTLPTAQVWEKRILEQSMELFDEAFAVFENMKDEGLGEKLYRRVLREDFCVRYLVINNYGSYYNISSPDYTNMLDEFEADMYFLQALEYREGKNTKEWLDNLRN